VTVTLALLASCAFALGSVLQQKGALETDAGEDDPRFLVQILHRGVWLAGAGAQVAGWVLQAAALDRGSLVVVQSLTALNLVIALPLGAWITDQRNTRRVWVGAGLVTVGIVVFVAVGAPQNGSASPAASAWWSAGIAGLAAVFILAGLGRRQRGPTAALLYGSAAGVAYAFQAAVTKDFVTLVGGGLVTILTSWTIYALIGSALIGFVFQQSALKTGVLAPAIASSNAVTLFGSIVFGITVFGDSLTRGGGRLATALMGLAAALTGILFLAGAKAPVPSAPEPGCKVPRPAV
jgi:drug/metabolite transporter (DMT)-like permease